MSETAAPTRDEISAAIAKKAWADDAFHKEILANPNKVYEQLLGHPVPNGMTIKVLEDTPTTVHFVLPAKPVNAGELSDAELEDVAGGATPTISIIAGATTVAAMGVAIGSVVKKGW